MTDRLRAADSVREIEKLQAEARQWREAGMLPNIYRPAPKTVRKWGRVAHIRILQLTGKL